MTIREQTVNNRLVEARALILSCVSPKGMGIWASQGRYAHQLWTRDFVLAAAPSLRHLGQRDVIVNHLKSLIVRQRPDGSVPVLFLDDEQAWLAGKRKQAETRGGELPFMLRAYIEAGNTIEKFSPWTTDSEVLFVIALARYTQLFPGNEFARESLRITKKALDYVEANLLTPEGFLRGADWRDTCTYFRDKALLSNAVLLHDAYRAESRHDQAETLRDRINDAFWTGTGYRDVLGFDSVDAFGQALGVISSVIPPARYPAVLASFTALHTPHGYLANDCPPNPTTDEERELLKTMPQTKVIWPFIHGYVTIALFQMGKHELAKQAFEEYTNMDGFFEWYDPATGKGYGAREQLWSAALYIVVAHHLGYDVLA